MSSERFYIIFEGCKRGIYESWPEYQREVPEYNHALYKKFGTKLEAFEAFDRYVRDDNNSFLEQYYVDKVKAENNLIGRPINVLHVEALLLVVLAFVIGFFLSFVASHL